VAVTSFAPLSSAAATPASTAGSAVSASLQSLPSLEVPPYMGTWYQVALFPNVFQRQCVSDTTATYRQLPDGTVEVLNRCRTAEGRTDDATGSARPTGTLSGSTLAPAQLKVSFLPAWLRWLPVGWGAYWVIQLADDGRYAVISEPSRQYLWILSRQPRLASADEAAIRARLAQQGFSDLSKLQMHRHADVPAAAKP
jgi:apolipoprotein D and lipocalin family protein